MSNKEKRNNYKNKKLNNFRKIFVNNTNKLKKIT